LFWASYLAVARGVEVISAVGEHDETLARELGATPVRYGTDVASRVRALGAVDAVFDAAGQGVLADAIALAGGPQRVITLSDPAAADYGVTLSQPTPDRAPGALDETIALLADGRLRLRAHIYAHAAGRRGPPPAGVARAARCWRRAGAAAATRQRPARGRRAGRAAPGRRRLRFLRRGGSHSF
jgi:hypothetical protein